MTPIEELRKRVGQEALAGKIFTPAPARATTAELRTAEAHRLDDAVMFSGLADDEVGALVLIGADAAILAQARAQLPACQGVLIVEPDPQRLRAFPAADAAPRCWVADLATPENPTFALGLYLEMAQFFINLGAAPGLAVVVDASGGTSAVHASALATARDFCSGQSANFFATLYDPARVQSAVLRALADFLHEVGETYHALKFYWLLHHAAPDLEVSLRALQCWAELDCPAQVERLLSDPIFDGQDELRAKLRTEIASQLRHQTAARQETFARNLAAIALDHPDLAVRLAAAVPADLACVFLPALPWRLCYDAGGVEIERGGYPLLVRTDGPVMVEVNPPPDLADIHQALMRAEHAYQAHVCVGRVVRHAAGTENLLINGVAAAIPGWQRMCYLVEPDTAALVALLRVMDLSDSVQRERPRLFVGPGAEEAFLARLDDEPNLVVPCVRVGVPAALEESLEGVDRRRAERVRGAYAQLCEIYQPARTGELLEILEGSRQRPLRVLFVSSLYTPMIRQVTADLAAAFEGLGDRTCIVQEEAPGQRLHQQTLTRKLLELAPDFVVMMNCIRAELPGAFPPGLPVVTWIQDQPPLLNEPEQIRALGILDLTFAFSASVARTHRELGYPHVGHLPFAINPRALAGDIPAVCRDEVVYATDLINPLEPESAPGDLDHIRMADLLREAGLPLALYGEGWQSLPRFSPYLRGVVEPGEPLWKVLRESKVVLHIDRGGSMHPRLLEGFAAGGFVLARRDGTDGEPGETGDQFALGRELILFESDEEMVSLIRRAFSDEPWRRGVIASARRRIATSHTYRHRVTVILDDLRAQVAAHLRGPARAG